MNKYNLMMRARADKRTEQIRRMRDRNLSWAQIARKMGISRQRVQQLWARSTNVEVTGSPDLSASPRGLPG